MVCHPEVQTKAHEELDRVVGRSRLPDFDDEESLPYLNAIFKETLRWYPVLPLSVPHSTTAEDVYKGMRIPRGSIIFANLWYGFYHPVLSIVSYTCSSGLWRAMKRSTHLTLKRFGPSVFWILTLWIQAPLASALGAGAFSYAQQCMGS
jgi:hypothetical protein